MNVEETPVEAPPPGSFPDRPTYALRALRERLVVVKANVKTGIKDLSWHDEQQQRIKNALEDAVRERDDLIRAINKIEEGLG